LVDETQEVRSAWQASAEPAAAERFACAVDDLCAGIGEHFDHEEQSLVPVIAEHITAEEWQAFIDRGAAYVKPTNLRFSLAYAGFLMGDATPDEQRRFMDSIPLPLKVVLKLAGKRVHSAYRSKLYS
jgi:hypothetical protein